MSGSVRVIHHVRARAARVVVALRASIKPMTRRDWLLLMCAYHGAPAGLASAGIGGDVQLATITASGVRVLAPDDLRAGNDALDVWQERCAELLPGASVRYAAEDTVDRGLRPPP
jgi:hypothetical protein